MIKVDPEFKDLIPPLSPDEYMMLEQSCVEDGIRDPLVVWRVPNGDDIMLDGHNRWEISAKHAGIPFNIVYKEFESREDAIDWIIRNQLGRRNIPKYLRGELVLKMKPMIAVKAKENQKASGGAVPQKSAKPVDTREELAKLAGVSHDTLHKVEVINEKASEEDKDALRRGEHGVSINSVYNKIAAGEHENQTKEESEQEWANDLKLNADPAVDLEDIKKDQDNKDLIRVETKGLVIRMIGACSNVNIIPDKDIVEMWKQMDEREKRELQNKLLSASRAVTHVLAFSED